MHRKQTNRHRQKRNCQEHFRDHHHLPVKDTKGWLVVQNGHAIKNQYHQKAGRQTDRQTAIQADIQKDRQSYRQAYRHSNTQADSQA